MRRGQPNFFLVFDRSAMHDLARSPVLASDPPPASEEAPSLRAPS